MTENDQKKLGKILWDIAMNANDFRAAAFPDAGVAINYGILQPPACVAERRFSRRTINRGYSHEPDRSSLKDTV